MTVIVRQPAPPLDRLVRAITYQAGEQPQTSVEKILPGPVASLWVNLNCDRFRALVGVTPTEYLRTRIDGPNHLRPAAAWPAG